MQVENVSRSEWILSGLGLFLVIDLLFFPWVDVSIGPFSVTSAGTGAPDGWLGVLGMLAALAFVVDLGLEKFASVEVPSIGGSRERTRMILAAVAAGCVALKFLLHLSHTGDLGFGCWLALVSAGALVFLTVRPQTLA
jgi:hypothetical protein